MSKLDKNCMAEKTKLLLLPSHRLPLVYLFVLGTLWGLHFSLIKLTTESGLSYRGIASATTAGAALFLIIIAVVRSRLPVWNLEHFEFYLICATLGYVLPFFLELYTAAQLPASILTLVVSSSPIFTLAIALLARTDTVNMRIVLSILIGCLSSLAIVVPSAIGFSDIPLIWISIALIIPLTYASYHNYISKAWPRDSDSFQVACGEAIVALVILLPLYMMKGSFADFKIEIGYGHLAIGVMVVFSVVEIFLYFEILRLAGPIFVSQANYITIVSGVIWGIIIFDEKLTPWMIISVVLLFIALSLNHGKSRG